MIETFRRDGYVRIDGAFSSELAASARAILWRDLPESADDPASWTRPVVRLGMYSDPPFLAAADGPLLRAAFDRLAGAGRWQPCTAMGTFPIRFPSPDDPGDTGWHVDPGFGWDAPDFMDWRANVASRGRRLLMLFLFSDVGADDAPTRLRVGSHRDMARLLAPAGDGGLTLREMAAAGFGGSDGRPEALATGPAGTVYLCHPFLVHAAQPHRGRRPRFMAQPPLLPAPGDGPPSPVEIAIRDALA
ncbi:phytanoyl-CoA dioxygenase family protein [Stella sp.]|uniref:phytanoyl-CoA dioxygenase family protein n=1 Tax=Stella sp. TaxID=2912054 RepID=UPI0035B4C030